MMESLSITFSCTAFSMLMYENISSNHDEEGFLLGEIIEKKTSNITDNDEEVTKIDRVINIHSIISWPKRCYFYNSIGGINEQEISNFLGDNVKYLVGWYKLKIISGIYKQTLREKIVHKELSKAFGTYPDLFVCGLFKADASLNGATRTNVQTFVRYLESGFHNIPMHITNLSDANNMYKTPQHISDSFKKVMSDLKINLEETPSLVAVTEIHTALLKRIDSISTDLADAEKYMHNLRHEVQIMYEKIKLKESTKWRDDSEEGTSPSETKYNKVLIDSNSKGTVINNEETHTDVISDVEMKNVHNLQNRTRQPDIRSLRRSSSTTNAKDSVPEKKGKRKNGTSKK